MHMWDFSLPSDQVTGFCVIHAWRYLTELFFAYSRDKYEVLSINVLADSYTYPKQVLDKFKNGEWTVSYKSRPCHSLALDEAQECIVNRKLKQITTQPSHFRMVDMADFMAYLDVVITELDSYVFKLQKDKKKKKSAVHGEI